MLNNSFSSLNIDAKTIVISQDIMKMVFPKKRSEAPIYAYQAVQLNLILLEHIQLSGIELQLDSFAAYLTQFAELQEAHMTSEVPARVCLGKDEVQVCVSVKKTKNTKLMWICRYVYYVI